MAEEMLIPDTTPIRIKCENLSASIIKMAEEILIKDTRFILKNVTNYASIRKIVDDFISRYKA